MRLRVLSLLLLLSAGAAGAQVGVYAMGSGAHLGEGGGTQGFTAYGGTFGLYDNFIGLGPIKLGGDARYFQSTSSNGNQYGNHLKGGLVGPRLALNVPLLPFRPYVQAEIGDVATNYGTLSHEPNGFAYEIQGGLDFAVIPHLDLRAEYGGGRVNGYDANRSLQEFGAGLVLRF